MKSCGLYSTLIVSAVVIWQMFSIASVKSSGVFQKCHTAVVTVVADTKSGTGFCIDPEEYSIEGAEETFRFVITAAHVVIRTNRVRVFLYEHKKTNGNWKLEECPAVIFGLDIMRDLAILAIECDTCDCTLLGALRWRLTPVQEGDSIIIIGDSINREAHSLADGKLSVIYREFCPASLIYNLDKAVADIFVSMRHGLIGCVDSGDSGSAVMDVHGEVIGMTLSKTGDLIYCVTMDEIAKAYNQIMDTSNTYFVGCTAHESALLGRVEWGDKSGNSIEEMTALANAMDTQYFAVAHDGLEAHAFTFLIPWWEILPGNDDMEEDVSDCRCEINPFTDRYVRTYDHGKIMCGCADKACRKEQFYEKRFGEDNDRRWAVYKVTRKTPDNRRYVPSNKSLHVMHNLVGEIDYWKQKVRTLVTGQQELVSKHKSEKAKLVSKYKRDKDELESQRETEKQERESKYDTEKAELVSKYGTEKAELVSNYERERDELVAKYKSYGSIVVAALLVASSIVMYLYKRLKNAERMSKETNTARDRSRERLSQQDVLQNSSNSPAGDSNAGEGPP